MKKLILIILTLVVFNNLYAQKPGTKKIVIISFDGLRWKEIFTGADSIKLFDRNKKNKIQ